MEQILEITEFEKFSCQDYRWECLGNQRGKKLRESACGKIQLSRVIRKFRPKPLRNSTSKSNKIKRSPTTSNKPTARAPTPTPTKIAPPHAPNSHHTLQTIAIPKIKSTTIEIEKHRASNLFDNIGKETKLKIK